MLSSNQCEITRSAFNAKQRRIRFLDSAVYLSYICIYIILNYIFIYFMKVLKLKELQIKPEISVCIANRHIFKEVASILPDKFYR